MIKIGTTNGTVDKADAALIKEIRDKLGPINAIRVTKWLTNAGLKDAKDFVVGL